MTNIYSTSGKVIGDISLPGVFKTEYRPDIIQRAVVATQANKRQAYGVSIEAGMQTSASYFGRRRGAYRMTINRGMSRLPREKLGGGGLGKVRRVPQSVTGRRAHPPKKKDYSKKLNKKEYLMALKSAIAATANKELVEKRGYGTPKELPKIVEDSLQSVDKTKDLIGILKKLGFEDELKRNNRKKMLVVVGTDEGIKNATSNLNGVNALLVDELNVSELSLGVKAGRLTIWTKEAIEKLKNGPV